MKVMCIFCCVSLLTVMLHADDNTIAFANRFFSEEAYTDVLKGIDYREKTQIPTWREFERGGDFLYDLATNPAPDFAQYLTNNVNDNPIAVYWSQWALGVQGEEVRFTVPEDYRKLLFIHSLQLLLTNEVEQNVCNKMFLDVVDRVPADSFYCTPYYYPAYEAKDHSVFLREVAKNIGYAADKNPDTGAALLAHMFTMQNGLSEWFWNSDFKQDILSAFGTGLVARSASPEPLPVFVDVLQEDYSDTAVYTDIQEGLTGYFTNHLAELLTFVALREYPDIDTNIVEKAVMAITEAGRTLAIWDDSLTDAISFDSLQETITPPANVEYTDEWERGAREDIDRFLYVVRALNTLGVGNTDIFIPARENLLSIALKLNRHSGAPYRDMLEKQLQAALPAP
ncbi:MAG: hypothetical protein EOM20_03000 [Spartobacteria bacterium]|nr:hypothetical protein [Spartobacteria bacterium]